MPIKPCRDNRPVRLNALLFVIASTFTVVLTLCGCDANNSASVQNSKSSIANVGTVTAPATLTGAQQAFTREQQAIVRSLALRERVPHANPSNRVATQTLAAEFGAALFFDKRLSADGTIACSTCHRPELAFTDGRRLAEGLGILERNTPGILGLHNAEWLYWDGRKDSLWSQALAPLEAKLEMGNARLGVLKTIGGVPQYRKQYTDLFGPFPFWVLSQDFSALASPLGNDEARKSWNALSAHQRQSINHAFANIGKAIAAFERTLIHNESRFDRFVKAQLVNAEGDPSLNASLNDTELAGLKLFIDESKTRCIRCHNTEHFSNNDFHNIGSGSRDPSSPNFGRFIGLQSALIDPFNCTGAYSDANKEDCNALRFFSKDIDERMMGAFKVPSLRNLNVTAPYFHDGRFETLEQVIKHYESLPEDAEVESIELSDIEREQLIAFLATLNSERQD